jgi:lipase ATG15
VSEDQSIAILAIKGTTLQGPTSEKDKFNDNLLFSCCCALVDFSWIFSTVCKCYANHWRCDESCLSDALIQDSLFYTVGVVSNEDMPKISAWCLTYVIGHCQ